MKGTHYAGQDAGMDGDGGGGRGRAAGPVLHYTGQDDGAEDGDIKWSNPLKRDKREREWRRDGRVGERTKEFAKRGMK